jgi:hypothetical protein
VGAIGGVNSARLPSVSAGQSQAGS